MCVTAVLPPNIVEPSPRGIKRSRSPEQEYGDYLHGDDDGKAIFPMNVCEISHSVAAIVLLDEDDGWLQVELTTATDEAKPRRRGRPPKTPRTSGEYTGHVDSLPTHSSLVAPDLTSTSQVKTYGNTSQTTANPTQATPPRATPIKPSTLKALPTVRDHTTDQLGPEGDEYVARDFDDAGEKKVDSLGYLQGGREYKIRTFMLPGRGQKLFMLATECARCLQYRDSYLLFNKNRSLFKIIASVKEKEELVSHDILPYSYRSRQIAIVTARSMFRQFGSRVIKDGRRVRDDYWEAKAIKQGFTEQDPAGEKRPGAARAREAAAAESLHGRPLNAYGDVVYSNGPGFGAVPHPALPTGIALPSFDMTYDPKYRDIARPRQELAGAPYLDITRSSTETEMAGQAGHAAEYSRNINQQGAYRRQVVDDYWHRPHDPPVSTPPTQEAESATAGKDNQFTSPRFPTNDTSTSQAGAHQSSATATSMNPPSFPHQQNPLQSPVRQSSMSAYPRDSSAQYTPQHPQYPRSSSTLSISQSASQQQSMPFGAGGYSPHGMTPQQQQQQGWGGPPPQPHQSPSLHRMNTPQFSPAMAHGQIPSPMHGGSHASQSPHPQQMQPPQMPLMHHQGSSGSIGGQQLVMPGAGLQAINAAGYQGMQMGQRAMYGMGGQQQYMQQGGQQHGQGWPGQQGQGQGGQWTQNYQ